MDMKKLWLCVLSICLVCTLLFPAGALAQAADALTGKTIGLDPGHQAAADSELEPLAPDSPRTKERMSAGCRGVKTKTQEAYIALEVANKVKSLLEAAGAKVVMTRTSGDVSLSNAERAQMMNKAEVDVWIRIHCNYGTAKDKGASILVPCQEYSPDICDASKRLGSKLLEAFCAATEARRLEVTAVENQTGFNWSNIPVAAIEMGFLSNPQEDLKLSSAAYQAQCAEGICQGVIAYFTVEG